MTMSAILVCEGFTITVTAQFFIMRSKMTKTEISARVSGLLFKATYLCLATLIITIYSYLQGIATALEVTRSVLHVKHIASGFVATMFALKCDELLQVGFVVLMVVLVGFEYKRMEYYFMRKHEREEAVQQVVV